VTDTPPTLNEAPAEETKDWTELISAIVLGIAGLLTAFAAYRGALTDGEALSGYTTSTRSLNDANAFYSQANQTFSQDQQLFTEFAVASTEGNEDLATFLRTSLMRPELQEAVDWWESTDEALTPFDEIDGNPYTIEDGDTAQELEEDSSTQFAAGAEADDAGDKFELSNVVFAITLFAAGIANVFSERRLRYSMVAGSAVLLVLGIVLLANAYFG
jgi:hypothetical protein